MSSHRIPIIAMPAFAALCIAFLSVAAAAPIIYVGQAAPDNLVRTADLGTTIEVVATAVTSAEGIVFGNGKMYWIDRTKTYVRYADLDGSNYWQLTDIPLGGGYKYGLELDGLGNFYYGFYDGGEIRSASVTGTSTSSFYSNAATTGQVKCIKIADGKLYWADFASNTINSINLDGTGATTLLSGLNDIYRLAIDSDGGKIYWTENRTTEKIGVADIDGSNPGTVLDLTGDTDTNRLSGLDFYDGMLYFGDWGTNTVSRINADGTGLETLFSSDAPTDLSVTPMLVPGDANGDGKVDAVDAAILASNWQKQTDASWGEGDFDGNGAVNDIDATLLAVNWNHGSASATVPEPGIVFLFCAGLSSLSLICLRRNNTRNR